MKTKNPMQLKAFIRNKAKEKKISVQLEKAQERFAEEAAALGLKTDEDVIQMIKEYRTQGQSQF